MNEYEAKQCHEAMLKFLRRNGEDKIKTTEKAALEEFTASKATFVAEEQKRIEAELVNRLE